MDLDMIRRALIWKMNELLERFTLTVMQIYSLAK